MATKHECAARLDGDILVMENARIRRTWRWNGGRIASLAIEDKATGATLRAEAPAPDLEMPGLTDDAPRSATFRATERPATAVLPCHLEAVVECVFTRGATRQVFRIFEAAPAIDMTLWVKRDAPARAAQVAIDSASGAIEDPALLAAASRTASTMDAVPLPGVHWRATSVAFHDRTDRCNNLVEERHALAYRTETTLAGNLLFLRPFSEAFPSLFIVKAAPCDASQLDWAGHDFMVRIGRAEVRGCGFTDEALDGWVRGHGSAVGVCGRGETERLADLRAYQKCLRTMRPDRDEMVMMNTWGDRARDGRLCERFALAEIAVAKELGITHFQLDDGWQKGLSQNSAFAGGQFPDLARMPDYWEPHPERFPNGLGPVVEAGLRAGVTVCLWFNPSAADDYAAWRQDADVLIGLHRRHGFHVFKIDGVIVESQRAEMRLRSLFDAVVEATAGEAVFNLDVTAGRRFGYFSFCEYGNVFLENRYTDWQNWYPTWTFRNLWQLARYVPPERLQIEFLNNARNAEKYGADDPLAPANVPFETALCMTLAAQPLAWFEGTGLVRDAHVEAARKLLAAYRGFAHEFHAGTILPVGDEPCGRAVAGFQSFDATGAGWLVLVREACDGDDARARLHVKPGAKLTLRPLGGGRVLNRTADANGFVTLPLRGPWSFGIWKLGFRLWKE